MNSSSSVPFSLRTPASACGLTVDIVTVCLPHYLTALSMKPSGLEVAINVKYHRKAEHEKRRRCYFCKDICRTFMLILSCLEEVFKNSLKFFRSLLSGLAHLSWWDWWGSTSLAKKEIEFKSLLDYLPAGELGGH